MVWPDKYDRSRAILNEEFMAVRSLEEDEPNDRCL